MKNAVIALALAAFAATAVTPAFANCGGKHGYRAAQSKKAPAKDAVAVNAAKRADIVAVGPQTTLIGTDGSSATF